MLTSAATHLIVKRINASFTQRRIRIACIGRVSTTRMNQAPFPGKHGLPFLALRFTNRPYFGPALSHTLA